MVEGNAPRLILFTSLGINTLLIEVPSNAAEIESVLGNVMLVIFVYANAFSPMLTRSQSKDTASRNMQFENALASMVLTFFGIVMLLSPDL